MKYATFTWIDYFLFSVMFGLSAAVGIYFGFFKKQQTTKDYLLGGKKMKVFPVAMSLVAGTLSGASLIGIPTEVYMFGTQISMIIIAFILIGLTTNIIFLPVFYHLQLITIFAYFEMRFDKTVRVVTSAMSTFVHMLALPLVVYAPSLAFNQITGLSINLIALMICLFCIFYTTLGGIRAVVWTDTVQFSMTLCTLAGVLVMGTISVGGPINIWEKAKFGDRLEFFNMNPDPTLRSSFWSIILGNYANYLILVGTNQGTVQRYLSVPTYRDAQKILVIFTSLTIITKCIGCFSGLIMYAKYYDCDPLKAGYIQKADQMLPYYVLEVASQIPGISGLFVSGLITTALSTLSTYLNSLAGIVYQDYILPFMPVDTSEKKASIIMKCLTCLIGVVVYLMVFIIERLGSIQQLTFSLTGSFVGSLLGVFILGVLFPTANKKGALTGMMVSTLSMFAIVFKNQLLVFTGGITELPKPLYTFGCNVTSIVHKPSTSDSRLIETEKPFWLFRLSFYYFAFIGTILTIVVGLLASWATGNNKNSPVNPECLSPCVRHFISKSSKSPKDKISPEIKLTDVHESLLNN